ncbi:MAG: alpha/beta hydrolase [Actinomycetota bacterium]|nr:alpha/beta hydrolase [Actinomycetota bacterium]
MSRHLVFIHGRAQQRKDPAALKQSWIKAWSEGLAKSDLSLPVDETAIHFPFYGDTLDGLVKGGPAPDVIIMGDEAPPEERQFLASVLEEAREQRGLTDAEVLALAETEIVELGPQNWWWVRAIVKALDEHLPGASGATLAAVTFDVYHYLRNPGVRDEIEAGVRAAIPDDAETIVVGHSLGSVIGYNLLRREGADNGWKVPLYVTLGSPLAVTAIRKALQPLRSPTCVGAWFNAMDLNDIVSLYPLEPPRFGLQPPIENKTNVKNHTANQHGIAGYLDDPEVASRIHKALVAP